ncbi:hypothetical protein ASF49_05645 [Methylobacterium sp. Leaf104]|uniref:hypothetical protein n=1 Tax=Methylobacterium TaxID=407 RepID=UPI0006FAAE7C|nr:MULTISPECIES: hypothetical protein [Methylobacterium]KQP38474.1 hypothetical protein ASF49_05645 [Methylobacterium sp. Leaf104]MCI9880105.1 hypothetical protein [Methylobacterium goesingense]
MSSNEPASDPALRRAEAARDAVTEAVESTLDRLATMRRAARADVDADLQAAGRLMARNIHRQIAANLTLVHGLMSARSLPAMLRLQQDYLHRQMSWARRDWDLARAQVLDLLAEGRRAAAGGPDPAPPAAGPPEPPEPEPPEPESPADPGPS